MYCAIWKAVDCRVVTWHDWNWCIIVNPGISLINLPEQNFLVRCWIRCVFYYLRACASTVQVEFWGSIQKLCLIISFLWSLISVLFFEKHLLQTVFASSVFIIIYWIELYLPFPLRLQRARTDNKSIETKFLRAEFFTKWTERCSCLSHTAC